MQKHQTSALWGLSSAFFLAVALAIFPGGPTFAGCTWTWDGENDPPGWRVVCSFMDEIFIEATDFPGAGGGTNGTSSCTNCVAMSPDYCNNIRSNIIERVGTLVSRADSLEQNIIEARSHLDAIASEVEAMRSEGDQFEGDFTSVGSVPGTLGDGGKFDYLINTAQGPYLSLPGGTTSSNDIRIMIGGVNSIYNYYHRSIEGFLDSVDDYISYADGQLGDATIKVDEVRIDAEDIRNLATRMNCDACSGSGSSGGGSGGGSGDGEGGTPGDNGCPCKDFILAVKAAVEANGVVLSSILSSVEQSRQTVYQILQKLEQIKTVLDNIKDDVYKIRQTTDLMDDFYKDDTEINFSKLIEHTLTLSNVVVDIPKLPSIKLFEDYTNATSFKMDDGSVRNWREWGAQVNTPSGGYQIDFGEYANMNWFQRIEFLLGRLSDIFTQTNNASVDFTSKQKQEIDETEAKFGDFSEELGGYEEVINGLLDKFDALKNYLNPFHDIFGNLSPPNYITILPEVQASGESIVTSLDPITLDLNKGEYTINNLLEVARSITTFLATVFLLLLNVSLVVFLVRSLFFVVSWFVRVYQSWSETLFSK